MEVWKDVKGYEGYYQVSDLYRVRSVTRVTLNGRHLTGRLLSLKAGIVSLHKAGKAYQVHLETLVAKHFEHLPIPQISWKLNPQTVMDIVEEMRAGQTSTDVALYYGVDQTLVSRIMTGERHSKTTGFVYVKPTP